MKYCSEHSVIQRFRHFLLDREFLHRTIVELCRTCQIILQCGGGQDSILDLCHIFLGLVYLRDQGRLHIVITHDITGQRHIEMVFKLLDVTTFLTGLESFGPGVYKHPDILGAGNHPVEIIGPHGILILICRQPEALSQFRRNE